LFEKVFFLEMSKNEKYNYTIETRIPDRYKWIWFFIFLVSAAALIIAISALFLPTTETQKRNLIDQFAITLTRKDIEGNVNLFTSDGTIHFNRLMTFLNPPPVLNTSEWSNQISVFLEEFITNHMTFSICSETYTCIGYYTYTFDFGPNTTYNLPSVMCSFSAQFVFYQDKIQSVEALPNATCTFVQYSFSGVEPPGPILTKKMKRSLTDLNRWTILQSQIQSLINNGQIQQAIVTCNTTQYLYLKSLFDPSGNTTVCRTLTHQTELTSPMICTQEGVLDQSCFPENLTLDSLTVTNLTVFNLVTDNNSTNIVLNGEFQCGANASFDPACSIMQTINYIPPLSGDFTFIGGPGIQMSGGANSLTVTNLGVLSVGLSAPSDEFNVTVSVVNTNTGTLTFIKKQQLQGLIWASPTNQSGVPIFRALAPSDLPSGIPANLITGVLPVENGGTGFAGPYTPNQIIVSSSNGTYLRTGQLIPSFGINITNVGGDFIFGVNTTLVALLKFQEVRLAAPTDIFNVTIDSVTQNGTLTFVTLPQSARTFWAGPIFGGPAVPSFRPIDSSDLPVLNFTVLNFTGVLPIANGGTGSSVSLFGNRVILSNSAGTSYIESNALLDGALIIGSSTGSPQSAQLIASSGITVINGPNSITLKATGICTGNDTISASCLDISNQACDLPIQSSCIPDGLSLTSLSVSGSTFLGTNTSCVTPLQSSCYDISNQQCVGGPLNTNCIPSNLNLDSLTVNSLTVLNYTIGNVASQEFLNITNLISNQFSLTGSMTCPGNASISNDCLDLAGATCTMGMPLSESCIPNSLVFYDLTVTHNLTINEIICTGPPMSSPCIQIDSETCSVPITDSCMQPRIKTINGVSPDAGLNFNVSAGSGISITSLGNGISIGNTGVLSVGLSVPSSEFTITGTNPIISTGTLTFIKSNQLAQTVWAGPLVGSGPSQPTFRVLDINDLPLLSPGQIYSGNGTSNVAIDISNLAITSVGLNAPAGLFSVAGSPVTSPVGGNFTLSLISQSQNQVFASPDGVSGTPSFRSLVLPDLPPLLNGQLYIGNGSSVVNAGYLIAGQGISITNGIEINNTGLLSAGLNLPSSIFNVSIPLISGPLGGDLTAVLIPQIKNTFWAGPTGGSPAIPTFRGFHVNDLESLGMTDGQLIIGSTGNTPVLGNLIPGANINITNLPGGVIISASINTSMIGTVMSVDMTVPSALLSVTGNPITSIGTFNVTLNSQSGNQVFASPSNGSSGTPAFRSLVLADLPLLGDGQILIGFNGSNYASSLTGGTGISIVNAGVTTVISTNISVGLSLPASVFSVSGSPVTSTGTLTGSLITQNANTVWAGPSSGSPATPTFRSLVPLDLPPLTNGQLYIGNGGVPTVSSLSAGAGITITPGAGSLTVSANNLGTVTSVGLALPVSVFNISGSPVTSSGTLTGSFTSQSANTVFAAPNGMAGVPSFRALTAADVPISNSEVSSSTTISGFSAGSFTVITGMSFVLPAGTWHVSFSCSLVTSTSNGVFDIQLFSGATGITHSVRRTTGSSSIFTVQTQAVITSDGVAATTTQWVKITGSGSADMFSRSMFAFRLS